MANVGQLLGPNIHMSSHTTRNDPFDNSSHTLHLIWTVIAGK